MTNLSEGTALERDTLLATKFHVPPPGFLPRQRLLARLTEAAGHGLTVVCTPAGFGKTTLLGDWTRHRQGPVAWLSLDPGDNDPARFWRYVAAALDRVLSGVGAQVAALLGARQPPLEAVVTTVVNELTAVQDQCVLILDDYHVIEASAVHESLAFLLDRLPPGLRLVIASRADPPLPLARLRVHGQLAELRERDLRFTSDEAAAFLREATGRDLAADIVAGLHARTEGWVAGLQLAGLSLRGHADPTGFVEEFTGSHRYVLDYLTEEVLGRQPDHVREFMLQTSVLDRLCGPLCDAVTGRGDSQTLLEALERANLFLVPLDEGRRWWRYHHLFADLLRVHLTRERPEWEPELHQAAAGWHEQHGLVDDAVRHALAAGDAPWAAHLVERHVEELLRRSEGATLRRWLGTMPAELVRARPRLRLAQAFWALVGNRLEEIEPLLADVERALPAAADEPHEPSVGRDLSVLANLPAAIAFLRAATARRQGDPERAIIHALQCHSRLGQGEWMLGSLARWELAMADWLLGRLGHAEQALAELTEQWRAAGNRDFAARAGYELGQVQRARGDLDAAVQTYRQALELAAEDHGPMMPSAGMAHVGMAEILYERGELDAALGHATQGVALCRELALTQPLATGLAVLARIRQAQGDQAGALDAIGEAERVQVSPEVVGLLNPVPAWRARLLLADDQVDEAARWAEERRLGAGDEVRYPREREYLVLARVLLAQQAPDRALGLLDRLHELAAAQQRIGSVIEVRALQALALSAGGDEAAALDRLTEALTLASLEGHVRVFVDEGPPMAALLGKLAARLRADPVGGVPLDYLARLAGAFKPDQEDASPQSTRHPAVVPGLFEPLTARELEVLALLAAGKSNREIAEELVVVLDTVKKHVTHIFDKLSAANRTQAVTRAQALGLLR